jgi:hypothetical protein
MKLNSTVALTLALLSMMLTAGGVSAFWGFTLGHEALKGVSQPDARPTTKLASQRGTAASQGGVSLLREDDILKSVKARIEGKGKAAKPEKPKEEKKQDEQKAQDKPEDTANQDAPQPGFPVATENQGVALEVRSARFSRGALLMKVNLKNTGSDTVRFLYSFLDVTDDQGRTLSASTEGLPAELPANGQPFSGTVSIPTALLDNVKTLSLTLTDYPDQKLRLELSNIPVER